MRPDDVPACAELLAALPDGFGLEEAKRGYIEGLSLQPAAVVELDGRVAGFVSIETRVAEPA